MYGSNVAPLPFNPMAMEIGLISFNANQPPPFPQVLCDPIIQSHLHLIAVELANNIQSKANTSNLRIFMFNQYARNGFYNPDFQTLVSSTVDLISLGMMKRMFMNIEQAIVQCSAKMVDYSCAINLRIFPALDQFVRPETENDIRNTIAEFINVAAEINANKNSMGGMPVNAPMMNHGMNMNVGGMGQGWNNQQSSNIRGNMGNSTSLFQNSAVPLMGMQTRNLASSKYGTDPNITAQFVQPIIEPIVEEVNKTPMNDTIVIADESDLKWKPSEKCRHFPAYNTQRYVLQYVKRTDGTIEPYLKERSDVDYTKHLIPTVFGPVPKPIPLRNYDDLIYSIRDQLKQLDEPLEEIKQEDGTIITVEPSCINYNVINTTSLEAAWFVNILNDREKNNCRSSEIFHGFANICKPHLIPFDKVEYISAFNSSNTFIELREKLSAFADKLDVSITIYFDKKLAEAVNKIINQRMGIPGLSIESFITDIQDLIELIEKRYGESVKDLFLKCQKKTIDSVFEIAGPLISEELEEVYLSGRNFEEVPNLLFTVEHYSLTRLNCMASELNIEIFNGASSALNIQYCPELLNIARSIMSVSSNQDEKVEYTGHLIKTIDCCILEINTSLFSEDTLTVSLISN